MYVRVVLGISTAMNMRRIKKVPQENSRSSTSSIVGSKERSWASIKGRSRVSIRRFDVNRLVGRPGIVHLAVEPSGVKAGLKCTHQAHNRRCQLCLVFYFVFFILAQKAPPVQPHFYPIFQLTMCTAYCNHTTHIYSPGINHTWILDKIALIPMNHVVPVMNYLLIINNAWFIY